MASSDVMVLKFWRPLLLTKMRFLRHPPCPPGPLLSSTADSRPTKMPTMGGMISRFHLPMYTHPRCADVPMAVTHVALATHGSRPAKTARHNHGVDITAALPSLHMRTLRCGPCSHDLSRTAAFNRTLLTNEYRKVGKQI